MRSTERGRDGHPPSHSDQRPLLLRIPKPLFLWVTLAIVFGYLGIALIMEGPECLIDKCGLDVCNSPSGCYYTGEDCTPERASYVNMYLEHSCLLPYGYSLYPMIGPWMANAPDVFFIAALLFLYVMIWRRKLEQEHRHQGR